MKANKTKTAVLNENANYSKLINAVLRSLGGMESLEDIRNHGIDGGFPGFTYYSDTVKFAHRNQAQIIEMLESQADDFGQEVVEMVSGFGVFRRNPMDSDDKKDLYRFLSGSKCKETTIPNLMAWYAAEEVARMFENN